MVPNVGLAVGLDTQAGAPLVSLGETLSAVADLGYTHAELSIKTLGVIIGGRLHPKRLTALQAALDGCSLRLTVHGTGVSTARAGNLVDITTPAQLATVKADLALAAAIGAEVLVYHSGMLRDPYGDDSALMAGLAAERDALRSLGDEAGRHHLLIAVENTDPVGSYIARRGYGLHLDRLAEQVAAVDHPNVKVCLDVGHAFLAARYLGTDYLRGIGEIAPLVGHLHVNDNLGQVQLDGSADRNESIVLGDGDLHLPPGWGAIPLAEVFTIPFPLQPTVILELRPLFREHFAEALAVMKRLIPDVPAPAIGVISASNGGSLN